MAHDRLLALLQERCGAESFTTSAFRDNQRVLAVPGRLFAILECLKLDAGFDMLADLTAVDYLYYPNAKDRFGLVYALLNTATGERVYVKTFLNEPDLQVPSAFTDELYISYRKQLPLSSTSTCRSPVLDDPPSIGAFDGTGIGPGSLSSA